MDPFIGEIRPFPYTYAPRGWAACEGQLMAISSNDALFSLIGTTYGGDGRTTFALPDLRGRAALHMGHGPGLSLRLEGQRFGTERVTVTTAEMPAHNHVIHGSTDGATQTVATDHVLAASTTPHYGVPDQTQMVTMEANMLVDDGQGQSHENMAPFLVIRYCIALVGIYPSRH
ncbi:phage tail protein [Roseospira goensis]|uniref:Microcystin-dependent protein n=1 Tax=Roseospira goensis TaxID=391922 RepID=A0A7W6WL24_9PROT|nr:tail fiber protein [Roseospira goensis]MBB4286364.1 microcystin-dependent protein [Roseospira goensis]